MIRAHRLQDLVDANLAPSVLYLERRLRRGDIPGHKSGRNWVMTDADIEAYLEITGNRAVKQQAAPVMPGEVRRIGISSASLRRRSA